MLHDSKPMRVSWLPLLLLPLLVACASAPPNLLVTPPAPALQIPPLPASARQPDPPPPICSPTCLESWSKKAEGWLRTPTPAAVPASSASAATRP